jgi:magnesium/cobalt transport protein CorA
MTVESRRFDADGTDEAVELDQKVVDGLTDRQLLWVDVHGDDEEELRLVAEVLGVERQSIHNLLKPIGRPRLDVLAQYFEINVVALGDEDSPLEMSLLAGQNWLATFHRDDLPFLDDLVAQMGPDTELGRLTAPSFLAAILDWQVGTYFEAVDELERAVDKLDDRALREPAREGVLRDLIRVRRRIAKVRRLLTPHREVFAALARPDFEVVASSESAAYFRALVDRLERAISAIENARELLIGSFDIFMTQTGQRTNDVMRILTIITVILLPAGVIAGVMGMNFKVGLFDDPALFWVVLGLMGVIAAVVLIVARRLRWI